MKTQAILWTLAGAALLIAVLAAFADKRRSSRRNLDTPGWVPWTLIQIIAGIAAVVAAALALKV
jgi:hypothetical protein